MIAEPNLPASSRALRAEDELQLAARAGMALLEKNGQLCQENKELKVEIEHLRLELHAANENARNVEQALENLKNYRRQSIYEVNDLNKELQAHIHQLEIERRKNTDLTSKLKEMEVNKEYLEIDLQAKVDELKIFEKKVGMLTNQHDRQESEDNFPQVIEIPGNVQAQMNEYENEVKVLKEKLEGYERNMAMLKSTITSLQNVQVEKAELEEKINILTQAAKTVAQEQQEERALICNLRSMVQTYKKIADARPFSVIHDVNNINTSPALGKSMHDELSNENVRLREKNALLQQQLEDLQQNQPQNDPSSFNESFSSLKGKDVALRDSDDMQTIESMSAARDEAVKRCQNLEEKLCATRLALRKAKQQWSAAVAYQKDLQDCNNAAQEELKNLSDQLRYQMSVSRQDNNGSTKPFANEDIVDDFYQDTSNYPAPPGDLNSPLIKCLLDNWTSDKARLMCLTDWLHHVIRGTGKQQSLKLERLPTEIAAGFVQLLVPVLRESHNANIQVFKRERREVMTDLIMKGTPSGAKKNATQ